MKILITGGAGFIGTAVLRYAKDNYPEHQYRSFDLTPSSVDDVEKMVGSILDSNQVSKAVRGCDMVIHLAAMLGVYQTDAYPLECLKINVEGTVNLLEACVRERVKKVIFSSSSEVYGNQPQQPISEKNSLSPLSVYGASKLAAEEYVKAYASLYQFHWAVMRFFNVYGPRQQPMFVIPIFVENVAKGISPSIYGDGTQVRSFCHVRDIAQGATLVAFKEEANGQIFNIGNDDAVVTMKELAKRFIRLSGKDLKPRLLPYANADRAATRDPIRRIPDISKARRILGYRPQVSLDNGLRELYESAIVKEPMAVAG